MLSPPEGPDTHDKGSLNEKGRERYLNSLEQRLARLEGGRGRRKQLTSKDILQSLSEARDDHMQQLVNRTSTGEGRNGPWTTGRDRRTGSGRESPYSIRNEFADVDLGEGGESGEIGRRETRVGGAWGGGKRTAVKRENRRKTGGSAWTCCLCCRGSSRRGGYSRARQSGDEAGEEGSRLVDCDELSLEWQSEDINDVT